MYLTSLLSDVAKDYLEVAIESTIILLGYVLSKDKFKKYLLRLKETFTPHDIILRVEIQRSIDKLRYILGSGCRVNVWQFNNGVNSFAGYSYRYMNIIYESHSESDASIKAMFQKVDVSEALPILERIQNAGEVYSYTLPTGDHLLDANLERMGIKCAYELKFETKDVYKGFLSLSFSENRQLTSVELQKAFQTSAYIYTLIKKISNKSN